MMPQNKITLMQIKEWTFGHWNILLFHYFLIDTQGDGKDCTSIDASPENLRKIIKTYFSIEDEINENEINENNELVDYLFIALLEHIKYVKLSPSLKSIQLGRNKNQPITYQPGDIPKDLDDCAMIMLLNLEKLMSNSSNTNNVSLEKFLYGQKTLPPNRLWFDNITDCKFRNFNINQVPFAYLFGFCLVVDITNNNEHGEQNYRHTLQKLVDHIACKYKLEPADNNNTNFKQNLNHVNNIFFGLNTDGNNSSSYVKTAVFGFDELSMFLQELYPTVRYFDSPLPIKGREIIGIPQKINFPSKKSRKSLENILCKIQQQSNFDIFSAETLQKIQKEIDSEIHNFSYSFKENYNKEILLSPVFQPKIFKMIFDFVKNHTNNEQPSQLSNTSQRESDGDDAQIFIILKRTYNARRKRERINLWIATTRPGLYLKIGSNEYYSNENSYEIGSIWEKYPNVYRYDLPISNNINYSMDLQAIGIKTTPNVKVHQDLIAYLGSSVEFEEIKKDELYIHHIDLGKPKIEIAVNANQKQLKVMNYVCKPPPQQNITFRNELKDGNGNYVLFPWIAPFDVSTPVQTSAVPSVQIGAKKITLVKKTSSGTARKIWEFSDWKESYNEIHQLHKNTQVPFKIQLHWNGQQVTIPCIWPSDVQNLHSPTSKQADWQRIDEEDGGMIFNTKSPSSYTINNQEPSLRTISKQPKKGSLNPVLEPSLMQNIQSQLQNYINKTPNINMSDLIDSMVTELHKKPMDYQLKDWSNDEIDWKLAIEELEIILQIILQNKKYGIPFWSNTDPWAFNQIAIKVLKSHWGCKSNKSYCTCKECKQNFFLFSDTWQHMGIFGKIRRIRNSYSYRFVPIKPHIRMYKLTDEKYLGTITGLSNVNERKKWETSAQQMEIDIAYQGCLADFVTSKLQLRGPPKKIEEFAKSNELNIRNFDVNWDINSILQRWETNYNNNSNINGQIKQYNSEGFFTIPIDNHEDTNWTFVEEDFCYKQYRFQHNDKKYLTTSKVMAVWIWKQLQNGSNDNGSLPISIAQYFSDIAPYTSGFCFSKKNFINVIFEKTTVWNQLIKIAIT